MQRPGAGSSPPSRVVGRYELFQQNQTCSGGCRTWWPKNYDNHILIWFGWDQSLRALGLDSLSALNVKIAVEREVGREIPLNLIQDDPTLLEFARRLALLDGDGDNEPKLSCENTAAFAETSDTDRAVSADAASSGGIARAPAEASGAGTGFALSLMFFSADEAETKEDRYRFVREASRIADARGFEAVWIPERHFHRFGGLFPNPAVVAAAIASETRHIRIRAGSVVLPLHDPIRVYEEWAVVDNLSRGRVDLSFADRLGCGLVLFSSILLCEPS